MTQPKVESYEVDDGRVDGRGGEVGSFYPVVLYPACTLANKSHFYICAGLCGHLGRIRDENRRTGSNLHVQC
jgi:hypothetical protein